MRVIGLPAIFTSMIMTCIIIIILIVAGNQQPEIYWFYNGLHSAVLDECQSLNVGLPMIPQYIKDCRNYLPEYISHARIIYDQRQIYTIVYWPNEEVQVGDMIQTYGQPDYEDWQPYIYLRWNRENLTVRAYSDAFANKNLLAPVYTVTVRGGAY